MRVRRCETPFVVLFIDRSGSSHFCSALDSHKTVVCRREDFCELGADTLDKIPPGSKPLEFVNRSFLRQIHRFDTQRIVEPTSKQVRAHLHDIFSLPVTSCGFKFKLPIQLELFPEVDQELRMMRGELKVIALFRNNALKQAISRQNLRRIQKDSGDTQHNLLPGTSLEPLRVDTESLLTSVRNLQGARRTLDTVVNDYATLGMEVHRVEYEDLIANPSSVFGDVLEFLKADPKIQLVSSYGKATPDNLNEAIENYDELRAAVAGTDLEQYL